MSWDIKVVIASCEYCCRRLLSSLHSYLFNSNKSSHRHRVVSTKSKNTRSMLDTQSALAFDSILYRLFSLQDTMKAAVDRMGSRNVAPKSAHE